MNRRDFMKLSAASAVTMGAVAGMAPASFAENAGVHTDAEVQAMVAEELRLSREVAFYPAAFRGDFDKFYVLFHKLSRAQYEKVDGAAVPGINASHYDKTGVCNGLILFAQVIIILLDRFLSSKLI